MISVKGLVKEFGGFQVLKGLDMCVKSNEIYGFIGQNGAGKTTTMNVLAGLSHPTQGECIVNEIDVTHLIHPGKLSIGYLPEDPKFYSWMTARETMIYLSDGYSVKSIEEIFRLIGLWDAQNRRVGGFSRGMKQRLGIGVALIRNPDLLILDEPSSALDPEGRSEVLSIIKDLKGMGKTILFSTHILDDVERVCDTIGMIDGGRMIFEKPLAQLQKESAQPVYDIIPVFHVESDIQSSMEQIPGVISVTKLDKSIAVKVVDNATSVSVMRFFADFGIEIESFTVRKQRLEDMFLQEVNAK